MPHVARVVFSSLSLQPWTQIFYLSLHACIKRGWKKFQDEVLLPPPFLTWNWWRALCHHTHTSHYCTWQNKLIDKGTIEGTILRPLGFTLFQVRYAFLYSLILFPLQIKANTYLVWIVKEENAELCAISLITEYLYNVYNENPIQTLDLCNSSCKDT